MKVRIEAFQLKDLPALRELYLQVRKATFTWLNTSHYHLESYDTDTQGEYTLVAFIGDVIVGFISAYEPDNFIHHIYVHLSYQKMGVGKLMVDAMLQQLKTPITLKCLQANQAAIAFYKKCGFVQKKKGISVEGIYIIFEYR
ncbi:GNAT family N-acetyltransferase [Emticicia sp. TH156]|uniref:GNAT family N-acetyltransferase n=1 Tax=Emticicia sp. TH156 TaxID=2067454 RepID=UPI001C1FE4D9|nr:GNAT family N-acetyltransferase [Emticicia sp. TH156]